MMRVPDHLSILSFDNDELATYLQSQTLTVAKSWWTSAPSANSGTARDRRRRLMP